MLLKTLADWETAGGAEMRWRLATSGPPATFAVCRLYVSWMKMFHLYLLSHDAAAELEFLEAVDELRLWEPQPAMSRRIYELYVSGEKADGQKKITVSGSIRQALTDAFKAVEQPDGAAVFAVAYQEVVRRVNEGSYLDFQETVEGLRAALNRLDDDHADADDDAGLSQERMVRGGRRVPVSVGERSLSAQGQDLAEQGDCLLVT